MNTQLEIYGARPVPLARVEEILDAEPGLVTGKVSNKGKGEFTIHVIDGESNQNFFVFTGPFHAVTGSLPGAVGALLPEATVVYRMKVADLPPSVEALMAVFVAKVAAEAGGHAYDVKKQSVVFGDVL